MNEAHALSPLALCLRKKGCVEVPRRSNRCSGAIGEVTTAGLS